MKAPTLSKNRLVAALGGLAVIASGTIASLVIGVDSLGLTDSSNREPTSVSGFHGFNDPIPFRCEPSPAGLLGRLSPGSTLESLQGTGYAGVQAIDGGDGDLVLLRPVSGTGATGPTIPEELQNHPALSKVGILQHATTDLSLRSCYHRFEDNAAAREISNRAAAWMVGHGVVTQEQIDAGGTTFQLAEDPTNPSHLFFTVLLATPGGGIPGSSDAGSLTAYVATIEKATGAILSAGRAHWY